MSDASGGHDLVQTPATQPLGAPSLLTVTQLSVKAPDCDQQNDVADGPEKTKQTETWDDQIPQVQVTKL